MDRSFTLDELWDIGIAAAKGCNGLCYHPCCDVWTTRAAKAIRSSHFSSKQWRQIILSLDRSVEDKKLAFQGKMAEEGWRLPALLNYACKFQPPQSVGPQTLPIQLSQHQPLALTQVELATLDFVLPGQNTSQMITPSGSSLLT